MKIKNSVKNKVRNKKETNGMRGIVSIRVNSSPIELKNWASGVGVRNIDVVLEYLHVKKCLNWKGEKLAKKFWEEFIEYGKSKSL